MAATTEFVAATMEFALEAGDPTRCGARGLAQRPGAALKM